jgi:hypothetical protein
MRLRAWVVSCSCVVALAPGAQAQPSAADLESARALFKQGKDLRAQGDLRGGLEKLKAAHALGQTPVTGVELARAYEGVGQLVEAREAALSVARLPVASDETDRSTEARADAAKLAEDLRPRIPSVVVYVTGTPAGAEAIVIVDGERVPAPAAREPRKTNPGPHVIVVRAAPEPNARESRETVVLAEREARIVALAFPVETRPSGTERDALPAPATPDGFIFGATFALVPQLFFPATSNPPAYVPITEVNAGMTFELGTELTPTFEVMARALVSFGDRANPAYAVGLGPAASFRLSERWWAGGALLVGRADTKYSGLPYSTDWVLGATSELAFAVIAKPEGQWLVSLMPGFYFANTRNDNAAILVPVTFGYRSF